MTTESEKEPGKVVDMFKHGDPENEVDPDEDHEERVMEELLQKKQEEKELLELLREWKAANA